MDKIFEKPGDQVKTSEVLKNDLVAEEKLSNPENSGEKISVESQVENEQQNLRREQAGEANQNRRPVVKTASQKREEAIDRILADGLGDIFVKLEPQKQQEFRLEGERTVKKINELLEKGKLTLGHLAELIRKWLSIIPGVNRFFLEQDAKIKADKIMEINKES